MCFVTDCEIGGGGGRDDKMRVNPCDLRMLRK